MIGLLGDNGITKEHGGAYGAGIEYLYQMKEWAEEVLSDS
jgi:hypothetical protein